MKKLRTLLFAWVAGASTLLMAQNQPNIVMIMGDDVGWFNIGAYHRGMMAGRTPHIDRVAEEGMLFTDYYGEPTCTAARANFITGQLPIRTGLTTVGQAGATVGMPAAAPTIATVLRSMGYATGQFGKNHLGDRNEYLPTVHGFDEFFGFLYHLDAMEDPFWHSYPPEMWEKIGPRNMLYSRATNFDDPTVEPRWGRVGKQKIVDAGPLPPERMKTVDEEFVEAAFDFIERAHKAGKPFFLWLNPSRMHVFTHLSDKYEAMMTPENGWYMYEAGMAQFDDVVGAILQKLEQMGIADNTIVGITSDNGAEVFTWPDGGMTPFAGAKGTALEGGTRIPMIVRWPGKIAPGRVENQIMSSLDWFPTFIAAAGNPNIVEELKEGKRIGDKDYKVHLDGYNQLDFLTGKGPTKRREIWYFVENRLGALRVDDYKYQFLDQPEGMFGGTVTLDWPMIYNLRLDPFERTAPDLAPPSMYQFFAHEFWRFVFAQEQVEKLGKTFFEYPPLQEGASLNVEAVKGQIKKAMESHVGH